MIVPKSGILFGTICFCVLVSFSRALHLDDFSLRKFMYPADEHRIPKVVQRMYKEWTTKTVETGRQVLTLPVNITQDGSRYILSARYPPTKNSSIIKAELWLEFDNIRHAYKLRPRTFEAQIESLNSSADLCYHYTRKPEVRRKDVELSFNVTSLYVHHKHDNSSNFQLSFSILEQPKFSRNFLDFAKAAAFVVVQETPTVDVEDGAMDRLKRMIVGSARKRRSVVQGKVRRRHLCKMREWYVSFAALNWDWILAPPLGFRANLCSGRCRFPLSDRLNVTNHAVIQSLVNSIEGYPRAPCCAPTAMSALTAIFLDESDVIMMKRYMNMVIDACGCL